MINKQTYADDVLFLFNIGAIDRETVFVREGNSWRLAPTFTGADTATKYAAEREALNAYIEGTWVLRQKHTTQAA